MMTAAVLPLLSALRDGGWFGARRARAYSRILLAMAVAIGVAWIALSHGGVDREGKPIGTDFVSFWSASRLALTGHPAAAWSVPVHWAAQRALFGPEVGYSAFFYPPPYLLICLPLALIPYFWSLGIWLAATGYAYWLVIRRILPGLDPIIFLAFPAVFINAAHGQNGFLSAALFGGGLLVMDRKPVVAGLLLGLLVFKPHLVLLLPLALVLARRWTVLAAAAASALAFCGLSYVAFGAAAWTAFLADGALARTALEHNLIGDEKMQSVFAAVRLLGAPIGLAYGLQGATILAAALALFVLHRRRFRPPDEAAAVVSAGLLASPFLLDYDLTLLAIPLAWLTGEGLRTGFRPYEKTLLLCGYLLPLLSRIVAGTFGLPLAPAVIAAILVCVLRRTTAPRQSFDSMSFAANPWVAPTTPPPSVQASARVIGRAREAFSASRSAR